MTVIFNKDEKRSNAVKAKKGIFIGLSVGLVVVFLMVIMPSYYVFTTKLPPLEQLNIIEGPITLKDYGRKGYKIGVKSDRGLEYFTCSYGFGGNHDSCSRELYDYGYMNLNNKNATIWWFEQPIHVFQKQQKIVKLEIDGVELISYEKTQKNIDGASHRALWLPVALMMFIAVIAYVYIRRLNKVIYE